jgi:hypothetical protein
MLLLLPISSTLGSELPHNPYVVDAAEAQVSVPTPIAINTAANASGVAKPAMRTGIRMRRPALPVSGFLAELRARDGFLGVVIFLVMTVIILCLMFNFVLLVIINNSTC